MFDLEHFKYHINNPSAWESFDERISKQMRAAAAEIARLRARPTEEEVSRLIYKVEFENLTETHDHPFDRAKLIAHAILALFPKVQP